MLISLFIAALVSGGLTIWLLWSQGIIVALLSGAVAASVVVGALSFVIDARASRATSRSDTARNLSRAVDTRPRS